VTSADRDISTTVEAKSLTDAASAQRTSSGRTAPDGSRAALLAFDASVFLSTLVERDEISGTDQRLALEVARQSGVSPLRAIVDLGVISEEALADLLAGAMGAARWRAKESRGFISDRAPRAFQRSASLLLLEDEAGAADGASDAHTLVVADPSDRRNVRAVFQICDHAHIAVAIGAASDIHAALDAEENEDRAETAPDASAPIDVTGELSALRDMASEAPVIRFFNQTIERALDLGASDVHVERYDRAPSLRLRVDGFLVEQPPPPDALFEALLCRIKILASLDISQRRKAQDGRIRLRLRGRMVDLRVSLIPTMYGQDAAIRIQDRKKLSGVGLQDLGFFDEQSAWLDRIARKSHGIVLITGPTGSGKTTTLYALLNRLAAVDRKIITVEDPVEFAMAGVNQIQVNTETGLGFATALRHVLRHDPDVILVGEIRDAETAQMAFQAALTGHMVLSTLHTNDAPGTFIRLIEMGVEPYLVTAAVAGATAQRLLRKICCACSNEAGARASCDTCAGLGYKGRVAVMELAEMSTAVKRALGDAADERQVREALLAEGYAPMREMAQRLVEAGVTDNAEVARALGASAIEQEP